MAEDRTSAALSDPVSQPATDNQENLPAAAQQPAPELATAAPESLSPTLKLETGSSTPEAVAIKTEGVSETSESPISETVPELQTTSPSTNDSVPAPSDQPPVTPPEEPTSTEDQQSPIAKEQSVSPFSLTDEPKKNDSSTKVKETLDQEPAPAGSSASMPSIASTPDSSLPILTDEDRKEPDVPQKIMEKQPAIGQLQLKELLSGTSMQIVEHAQKLAETPLIGTVPESTAPILFKPDADGAVTNDPNVQGPEKQPNIALKGDDEDQFEENKVFAPPGANNMVVAQEDDYVDAESYEIYTIPEDIEKQEDVPSILKRYLQTYNDEKLPIARHFKIEDEDKLNEAATFDIQPSYQTKPSRVIRVSVLEKVLLGILEYRLGKLTTAHLESKVAPKQLMQVISEDVATSLGQLRFSSYKYSYFITVVPRNHQDILISTRQLWDPETDRRAIAKLETSKFHASIIVHFIFHP